MMDTPVDTLALLEENLRRLLEAYRAQTDELKILREANVRQREELIKTHGELTELQAAYKRLNVAATMVGAGDNRELAKRQITALIQKIDKALALVQHA